VGPDHSARETLPEYGQPGGAHRFRLIHLDADGVPEQHAHVEDVVFVQSGAATLQLGGVMVNPSVGDNGESIGTDIRGGVRHVVGPATSCAFPRIRRTVS